MTSPQTGVTPLTVPALLADRVRASGQDTYVITPDGRLTYAQADASSADIARRLLAAGVGKGSRVGLFFPNGLDWISWWLALSRIGLRVGQPSVRRDDIGVLPGRANPAGQQRGHSQRRYNSVRRCHPLIIADGSRASPAAVRVVPSPPLVGRGLGVTRRGVLPRFLTA